MTPCARCGERAAAEASILCDPCTARGPLSPEEADRYRARLAEDDARPDLAEGDRVRHRDAPSLRGQITAIRNGAAAVRWDQAGLAYTRLGLLYDRPALDDLEAEDAEQR